MRTGRTGRGVFVPLILILVGGVLLLQHRGMLPAQFTHDWWPLLLVIAGVVLLARRVALRR
ncbi:LiaI-LiaF-like domain-containing protein [Cupriavidus numazuensis]|uniref:LiaI-LiaF-like transmembrane region domain-containing protein n=1 Tax=Cupriavidus numazuensis TaxID=221992 RepID=A0ABM8TBU9_9BURK|nr:DUF5668 domain-containing protein [Cupriavidus numazuensis]CAG2133648.1 hypothetical protein LMG26411_00837 [Cupriavidus numazuensis]